jgi:ABC-type branched-subunit amino acid transport system substrate-binding protein
MDLTSRLSAKVCRTRPGALGALVLLLCGSLLLAACGGSDNSESTGSGTEPTSSGNSSSAESVTTAQKPTGKPIVVADVSDATGFPGSPLGELAIGGKAAVDYINEELGGLEGRPFELWTCDSKLNPAESVACAQRGIDQDPIASVGLSINWAENGLPIWTKAGIPSMSAPVSPGDCTNPLSFPLVGGVFAESLAQGQWMADPNGGGAESVAYLGLDSPATREQAELIGDGLKRANEAVTYTQTYFPLSAADLTPASLSAVKAEPDMVGLGGAGAQFIQLWQALAQNGYTADKTMSTSGTLDVPLVLEPAGGVSNGAYFSDPFVSFDDEKDAQVKIYLEAMKKYQPDASPRAVLTQWGFANIMTFYSIGKELGAEKLDAAALAKYMKTATDVPVFMSKTVLAASVAEKQCPSVRNPWVRIVQWNDGQLENVTPFENAFEQ